VLLEKKDKPKAAKEKRKKPDASVASPAPKEAKIEKVVRVSLLYTTWYFVLCFLPVDFKVSLA
jgi:hypothetical protein